jgi:hypothetical protein
MMLITEDVMYKKALFFGGLALFALTLLVFVGCPDVVNDPPPNPNQSGASVTLDNGSHGTGTNGGVTGLTQAKYLVRKVTGDKWYGVGTNGAVVAERNTIGEAIADITGTVTTITGLTNGLTYEVYLYQTAATGTSPEVDNKTNVIDISALTTGQSITLKKASTGAGGSVIIYTADTNVVYFPKATSAQQFFGNTTNSYQLTSTTPDNAKVEVKAGDKYATFDLSLATTNALDITITVGAVIPVSDENDSQGTLNTTDGKITGLTSTEKYVVHNVTLKTWHAVKADGTLDTDKPDIGGAIDLIPTAGLTGTEITGLIKGFKYNVFLYVTAADGDSIETDDTTAGIKKGNGIIDISGLAATETVTLTATAASNAGAKAVYVYTGDPNKTAVAAATIATQEFGNTTAKKYTLGTTVDDGATILAPVDAPYALFDFSPAIGTSCTTTITVEAKD